MQRNVEYTIFILEQVCISHKARQSICGRYWQECDVHVSRICSDVCTCTFTTCTHTRNTCTCYCICTVVHVDTHAYSYVQAHSYYMYQCKCELICTPVHSCVIVLLHCRNAKLLMLSFMCHNSPLPPSSPCQDHQIKRKYYKDSPAPSNTEIAFHNFIASLWRALVCAYNSHIYLVYSRRALLWDSGVPLFIFPKNVVGGSCCY